MSLFERGPRLAPSGSGALPVRGRIPPLRRAGASARPVRAPRAARAVSAVIVGLLLLPIGAGVAGVVLPAFGIMPALGRTEPTLGAFAQFFAAPGIGRSILLSAWSALAATLAALAITLAVLCATFGSRALALAERVLAPILAVPYAAAALGLVFLFAPSGFLLRLLSPWATGFTAPPDLLILRDPFAGSLIAALVIKEVPFLFLMALAALPQTNAAGRFALARTLGYGRFVATLHGVWPLVYRQIRLPVLAVLAFSASVVDVALVLGPTRPPPLAVRIVEWLQSPQVDAWFVGSAAATVMLGLVLALVVLWRAGERMLGACLAGVRVSGWRGRRDFLLCRAVIALAAAGFALVFAGFAGLVLQSAAGYWPFPDTVPANLSLAAWSERLPAAWPVLADTLAVALAASALTLVAAVALLEADRLGASLTPLVYAPLLVPQVAFLFGLNVLAIGAGLAPGLLAVVLAHTLFTLPYALIALSGHWRALDPRYEASAAALGVRPLARFARVRLPMLFAPLCVTAALAVAVSVALYLPTQLVGGGRIATVTTEAVAAAAGGDRRVIGLWATLQLVLPMFAFALARSAPALAFRHRRAMRPVRLAA